MAASLNFKLVRAVTKGQAWLICQPYVQATARPRPFLVSGGADGGHRLGPVRRCRSRQAFTRLDAFFFHLMRVAREFLPQESAVVAILLCGSGPDLLMMYLDSADFAASASWELLQGLAAARRGPACRWPRCIAVGNVS